MFKFLQKLTANPPVKDALSAGVVIARQRNERAAENLRDVITELLDENDRLKGKGSNR